MDEPCRRTLRDVCSRDQLPSLPVSSTSSDESTLHHQRPWAVIVNTASSAQPDATGEHWILAFIGGTSSAYFFDSVGHGPNFYGHEISQWFSRAAKNAQMLETNTYRTQPEYSVLCGLHVLYVLYFLARGESLSSVIGKFSVSDLLANDRLVQQFAYKRFHFDASKNIPPPLSQNEYIKKAAADLSLVLTGDFL